MLMNIARRRAKMGSCEGESFKELSERCRYERSVDIQDDILYTFDPRDAKMRHG